jgi:hypothetical protein
MAFSRNQTKKDEVMGMDLIAVEPYPMIKTQAHYNWTGWNTLRRFLDKHGVDISEFSGSNDGDLISKQTCREVAIVIEDNLAELQEIFGDYIRDDINFWRHCGGCAQR